MKNKIRVNILEQTKVGVSLSDQGSCSVRVGSNNNIRVNLKGTLFKISEIETYDGEYEIFPKVVEQNIPTAEKRMREDLAVHSIPKHAVSNDSGITIIIGGN